MDVYLEPGGPTPPADTAIAEGAPTRRAGVGYGALKRATDVTLGAAGVVLGAPVFLLLAMLVKATSPGPALFWQRRLGQGGRVFWCCKFRTMVVGAEGQLSDSPELRRRFEADFKIKDDPRVTRLGRFLRKTSLDELPQIFNVLRGEISLIGPRPVVPDELPRYGVFAEKLLSVPQGLSGYWQVFGRSDTTYSERIHMDMKYIDNRSFWLDARLIGLTVVEVLRGRGAY